MSAPNGGLWRPLFVHAAVAHAGHLLARQCVFPFEAGGVFEVLELLVDTVDHLDGHTLNNGLVEEVAVVVLQCHSLWETPIGKACGC